MLELGTLVTMVMMVVVEMIILLAQTLVIMGTNTKAKIHLCQIPDLPFTNHVTLESYVASFSQYLSCEI